MSEEKRLFKEKHYEKEGKTTLKGKWLVLLFTIYLRLNTLIMWFTIILNAILIFYMLLDFNVGIILFVFNQYLVVASYLRLRRERREKKIEETEAI